MLASTTMALSTQSVGVAGSAVADEEAAGAAEGSAVGVTVTDDDDVLEDPRPLISQ